MTQKSGRIPVFQEKRQPFAHVLQHPYLEKALQHSLLESKKLLLTFQKPPQTARNRH